MIFYTCTFNLCWIAFLFSTQFAGEWKIYPWIHSNCNSISDDDQLRAISFPDIHPARYQYSCIYIYLHFLGFLLVGACMCMEKRQIIKVHQISELGPIQKQRQRSNNLQGNKNSHKLLQYITSF